MQQLQDLPPWVVFGIGAGLFMLIILVAGSIFGRRNARSAQESIMADGMILGMRTTGPSGGAGTPLELVIHVQQPNGVPYQLTANHVGDPGDAALQVGQPIRLWLHPRKNRQVLRLQPLASAQRGFAFEQSSPEPANSSFQNWGSQASSNTVNIQQTSISNDGTPQITTWNSASGSPPPSLQGLGNLNQFLQQVLKQFPQGGLQQTPQQIDWQINQVQRAYEQGAIDAQTYAQVRQALEKARNGT